MRIFLNRLLGFLHRGSAEADLAAEIAFHLQSAIDENIRRGMPPEDARRAALRSFGGITGTAETYRETRSLPALENVIHDLRYACRILRQSPGFTTVAVLSLALGIGANTAIFSLLNAVVLRTLAVPQPERLVQLVYTGPGDWNPYFDYPQFEHLQRHSQTLSGVFAANYLGRANIVYHGVSELGQSLTAGANTFSVLGVVPQAGRFFTRDEDRSDTAVAVLSDSCWRNRFGADPAIVGGAVTINQRPFTVVGVTPANFPGLASGVTVDVWLPLHALDRLQPRPNRWTQPFTSWLTVIGRLRPGVSAKQAQAELDMLHRKVLDSQLAAAEQPSEKLQQFVRASHLEVRSAATGTGGIGRQYALPLRILMWVTGIVLLVACANVANLLLARASNRRREIAVRLSLGAARGRIVRQLLTENLLLGAMGGALAFVLAWWGSLVLVRMIMEGETAVGIDMHPDWRVFGFTAGVSLITGILFGLAPALRATRIDPGPALKQGGHSGARSRRLLDRVLVIAQVALSLVLLTGAGLFVRTLHNLWTVKTGYDRDNVLQFSVDAKLEKMQGLPDVRSAGASIVRPLDDQFDLTDRVNEIDGRALAERDSINVSWNAITPGYFATLQTPVVLGRDLDPRDNESAPKVVIVNESMAARAFAGQSPLGHRIGDATVVGVVKDSLYSGARDRLKPVLFYPMFQHGADSEFRWAFVSYELRYRTGSDLLAQARREVAAVDRNLPVFRAKTLRVQTEQAFLTERLLAMLSTFFGALALVLACLGIYGLMAYAVARRTAEFGIRAALGAGRAHVMWLVLRETLGLSLAGIAAGIPLAMYATRYARSLLFQIEPADPVSLAMAVVLMVLVAGLAASLPIRRALRLDPMTALRCE
jgi:predicted permease